MNPERKARTVVPYFSDIL